MPEWMLQFLLAAAASVLASGIVAGVTVFFAFGRLEERSKEKFKSLEEAVMRVEASIKAEVEQLEEQFEQRIRSVEASTTQRVDDWRLWRVGLEDRLKSRADHLSEHEKECSKRWATLLEKQGSIAERLLMMSAELEKRGAKWELLLEEHGGVMKGLTTLEREVRELRGPRRRD